MNSNNASIPRAGRPEEVGVSSVAIAEYVRDIEESGIESHSLMVIRHGKVAYESYRKPYAADIPHTLYSVSKSIMSIAAGFAVTVGCCFLSDFCFAFLFSLFGLAFVFANVSCPSLIRNHS